MDRHPDYKNYIKLTSFGPESAMITQGALKFRKMKYLSTYFYFYLPTSYIIITVLTMPDNSTP